MLEIIVGAVVILVILGAVFGFLSSASEGENPVKGAAQGAAVGAIPYEFYITQFAFIVR